MWIKYNYIGIKYFLNLLLILQVINKMSSLLLVLIIVALVNVSSFNPFSSMRRIRNTPLKSEIVERNSIEQKPAVVEESNLLSSPYIKDYKLHSINEYDFDEYINDKAITVCLMTSSWCVPCKNMEKTLISTMPLFDTNEDMQFIKIDTDNSPDLVHSHEIRSIPSTLIFRNGKVVSEIIGSVNKDVVLQHIQMTNDNSSFQ